MAPTPYISYRHVYKAFGPQAICKDFSLDIHQGETLCVIGPSGVGKTVTIKLLIGLLMPDAGEIWFDGQNVADFWNDSQFLQIRRRIAMVFQGAALFDSLTVFDNIAYPLREQRSLTEQEIEHKVYEKLEWVGLPDAADKLPAQLSGGMKKRIGLARSIVAEPEVILYDEPTAGLDPVNTTRIVDLILKLKERMKCTSIVVTHDIPAVKRLSDRAAFFFGGKVAALGSFDSLLNGQDTFVKGFLQGDPQLAED